MNNLNLLRKGDSMKNYSIKQLITADTMALTLWTPALSTCCLPYRAKTIYCVAKSVDSIKKGSYTVINLSMFKCLIKTSPFHKVSIYKLEQ
jgi:hypothetical protein